MRKDFLQTIMQNYMKSRGVNNHLEPQNVFEWLVASCISERYRTHGETTGAFSTGTSYGLDAVILAVNNTVIQTEDELRGLQRQTLYASLHFIQCKYSASVDKSDLLKMKNAVERIMKSKPLDSANSYAAEITKMIRTLYKRPELFDNAPSIQMHLAFAGSRSDLHPEITALGEEIMETLNCRNQFGNVAFDFMDTERTLARYREITTSIERTITATRKLNLPTAEGVEQAILAVLPWSEYRKLVLDVEGRPIAFLFDDNIRDFQGMNTVNSEIADSLDPRRGFQDKFAILNNGITIVADKVQVSGDNLTLRGYQIVNGCQTTHVLSGNDAILSDSVHVPVKIIEVGHREITNKIIRASNRQTEVKNEAFVALDEFHRSLERFFETTPDKYPRLFYERRSKQHVNNSDATVSRIVTLAGLLKQFVSVFLEEPYKSFHYYGELFKQVRDRAFTPVHSLWPYYCSALISYFVSQRFNISGHLFDGIRQYKPHICWVVRCYAGGRFDQERLKDEQYSEKYCRNLAEALANKDAVDEYIQLAADSVRAVIESEETRDDNETRSKAFFDRLRDFVYSQLSTSEQASVDYRTSDSTGLVPEVPTNEHIWQKATIVGITRNFGFCRMSISDRVFFHKSNCSCSFSDLRKGQSVEIRAVVGASGWIAVAVRQIPSA